MNRTFIVALRYPQSRLAFASSERAASATGAAVIEARGLTKRFGERAALRDVSFAASRGRAARGDRPERRRQDDAALDPRRDPRAPTRATISVPRRGRLGAAAGRRSTARLTVAENLRLFARLEGRRGRRGGGRADARPDRARRAARRPGRHALGRQPAARQHRDRPARPSRRCCCSTSRRPASTRASASACGSSSLASPGAGTTVIYSTHHIARGRALRRPAAGARRRRAPLRRHLEELHARRSPTPGADATSRRPSSPSCASGATDVRWLLAQGPADPAPLAADRRRCWSSTRSCSAC